MTMTWTQYNEQRKLAEGFYHVTPVDLPPSERDRIIALQRENAIKGEENSKLRAKVAELEARLAELGAGR